LELDVCLFCPDDFHQFKHGKLFADPGQPMIQLFYHGIEKIGKQLAVGNSTTEQVKQWIAVADRFQAQLWVLFSEDLMVTFKNNPGEGSVGP
jgi:hypothetical protein